MVTWVVVLAAALVAAVAAAGVLRPFGRRLVQPRGSAGDPMEDERERLLRALRDLKDERDAGTLPDGDYRALRRQTEQRAVAVLRALEARDGAGSAASALHELRVGRGTNGEAEESGGGRRSTDRSKRLAVLLVGALLVSAVVPALSSALRAREAGRPITGDVGGQPPLAFFEDRVRNQPGDPAARLDLAQRYLELGEARAAIEQYMEVLRLDPPNAEAHAKLGYLLFLAGRTTDGLGAVDRALETDPTYPEALFFRGVILLEGLDRPGEAAEAFRGYLEAAPFGARRAEAQFLLERAERTSEPG